MAGPMPDYEKTFIDFWQSIVEGPDGSLNRDQVMRELHDYHNVMEQVSIAYCDITGGRISKPNTAAFHVIDEVEERTQEAIREACKEIEDHTETLAWLRDLNVTIHGDRATAGITPAAVRSVLDQRGWKVTSGNEIREWRRKEGARHRHGEEVFVPLDASNVDYNRRVRDLLTDVAEAEGCGVLGLLLDLRAASKEGGEDA